MPPYWAPVVSAGDDRLKQMAPPFSGLLLPNPVNKPEKLVEVGGFPPEQYPVSIAAVPGAPGGPVGPMGPCAPGTPCGPANPVGPCGPAGPVGPVGPTAPSVTLNVALWLLLFVTIREYDPAAKPAGNFATALRFVKDTSDRLVWAKATVGARPDGQ